MAQSLNEIKKNIKHSIMTLNGQLRLGSGKGSLLHIAKEIEMGNITTQEDFIKAIEETYKIITNLPNKNQNKNLAMLNSSQFKVILFNYFTIYIALFTSVFRYEDEINVANDIKANADKWFTLGGLHKIKVNRDIALYYKGEWYLVRANEGIVSNGRVINKTMNTLLFLKVSDLSMNLTNSTSSTKVVIYPNVKAGIPCHAQVENQIVELNEKSTISEVIGTTRVAQLNELQLVALCAIYMKYNRTSNGGGTHTTISSTPKLNGANTTATGEITIYLPSHTKSHSRKSTSGKTGTSPREHERSGGWVHYPSGKVGWRNGCTVNAGHTKANKYKIK